MNDHRHSELGYCRPHEVHYSYQKPTSEPGVRKVVLVSTDEYEKGLRRGEQIQWMQAYYGQQRRRHLYDLGVVTIKRLNTIFHAHSEEYWRGYTAGTGS